MRAAAVAEGSQVRRSDGRGSKVAFEGSVDIRPAQAGRIAIYKVITFLACIALPDVRLWKSLKSVTRICLTWILHSRMIRLFSRPEMFVSANAVQSNPSFPLRQKHRRVRRPRLGFKI